MTLNRILEQISGFSTTLNMGREDIFYEVYPLKTITITETTSMSFMED